jgi:hypothetical protein
MMMSVIAWIFSRDHFIDAIDLFFESIHPGTRSLCFPLSFGRIVWCSDGHGKAIQTPKITH